MPGTAQPITGIAAKILLIAGAGFAGIDRAGAAAQIQVVPGVGVIRADQLLTGAAALIAVATGISAQVGTAAVVKGSCVSSVGKLASCAATVGNAVLAMRLVIASSVGNTASSCSSSVS